MKNRSPISAKIKANNNETKNILIFGSAFDPPHYGHLATILLGHTYLTDSLAKQLENAPTQKPLCKTLQLAEVWLYPSPARWDKTPYFDLTKRVLLTNKLAQWLREHGVFAKVAKEELQQPQLFLGTTRLLQGLVHKYPDKRFYFLCGEDSLVTMPTWRDGETQQPNGIWILENIPILVVPRKHAQEANIQQIIENHQNVVLLPQLSSSPLAGIVTDLTIPLDEISSSLIRHRLTLGESSRGLTLPEISKLLISGSF